jgi:hypothetical protein
MGPFETRLAIVAVLSVAAIVLALIYHARFKTAGGGNVVTVVSALGISSAILVAPMLPRMIERFL